MNNKLNYKRCYLYVLDSLADWEISFITAELNSKRYFSKDVKLDLIIVGNSLKAIKTMGGMTITPDHDINNIKFEDGDLLILPGANSWLEEDNKRVLEIVSDLINKNITIAAICGATVALAQNGLLDNRKHTSNSKEFLKMFSSNYNGDSYYTDTFVVTDNNLITATGLAPLEFSYEIFKKLDIMKTDTLKAWYQLYKRKDSKSFYSLMESLN